MRKCYKCDGYHNSKHVSHMHNCMTFDKFTFMNKDLFMRRKKQQQKMSKLAQKSAQLAQAHRKQQINMPMEGSTDIQSLEHVLKPAKNENKNVKPDKDTYKKIDQRVLEIVFKSYSRRRNRKSRQCLLSTSAQQTSQIQSRVKSYSFADIQEEIMTDIALPFVKSIQTPFQKPNDSAIIFDDPIIYNTLTDNRLCGFELWFPTNSSLNSQLYNQIAQKIREFK